MNQTELEKHNKDLIQILLAIKPMTTDEVMGYVNKVNKLYGSLIETERKEAVEGLVVYYYNNKVVVGETKVESGFEPYLTHYKDLYLKEMQNETD